MKRSEIDYTWVIYCHFLRKEIQIFEIFFAVLPLNTYYISKKSTTSKNSAPT